MEIDPLARISSAGVEFAGNRKRAMPLRGAAVSSVSMPSSNFTR